MLYGDVHVIYTGRIWKTRLALWTDHEGVPMIVHLSGGVHESEEGAERLARLGREGLIRLGIEEREIPVPVPWESLD